MTGLDLRCGDCGAVRSCSHDEEDHHEDHDPGCGVHAANGLQRYTLSAELGDEREEVALQEENDWHATLQSIKDVLDRAHNAPAGNPWRYGKVELRDGAGFLIREMPANEVGSGS